MHTDLDVCVCVCVCHLLFIFLHINAAWTLLQRLRRHSPPSPLLLSYSMAHPALGAVCIFGQFQFATGIFSRCTLSAIYLWLMFAWAPPPHPQYSPLFAVCPLLSATGSANCSASASDMLFGDFECAALEIPKKKFRVANEFLQRTRTHPQPHSHTATHTQAHTYRETHTNMTTHTTAFTCRNA